MELLTAKITGKIAEMVSSGTYTYVATLDDPNGFSALPVLKTLYQNWKTFFQFHGINEMSGYEGGYSPDMYTGTRAVLNFRAHTKHAPALNGYTVANFDNFTAVSDTTFLACWPSQYLLTGSIATGKTVFAWSTLDDLDQNPDSPSWLGLLAIAARKPRLKSNTSARNRNEGFHQI